MNERINPHAEYNVSGAGLISRKNAARYLGLSPKTLACWNSAGQHEDYFKKVILGSRVFYEFSKVTRFAEKAIERAV